MAIAFDNSLAVQVGTGNITQAFTVNGPNPYLQVSFLVQGSNTITGTPTYAGVNMTLVDSSISGQGGGTETVYVYALNAPATGTHNIVATFTGGTTGVWATALSGASQSAQPEAHALSQSNSATSFSQSVTVLTANAWLVGSARTQNSMTAGSNTDVRDGNGTVNISSLDSNSVQTTGSHSMTVTVSAGYGVIFVTSVAPAATSQSSTHRTLLGVGV